ncbi:ATP-dependent Clp protease adaptor ClpS [Carboxylicivirga mesophila]|uniref:ATP-dependent Clp protease adaptor ClpS n=2 Tax=Carboxylicivirga TaxID=1628153 RepID=A0A941F6Y8_9BACT|nr:MULTISPECIES: ATP-dependent Clp protease adaptor ClpS [Carboxylicivirga]MBR8537951.1 ATP-dependent Clp protease adaptor ClpS [Carboxylicivirga sediminis]MBS2212263.1 ATP-dependent Clp protease adaptor ClpS [Carboxylicivirga mesophila]
MVSFSKRSEEHNREGNGNEVRTLTLHNDDINSFDHVIDVLCEVCQHDAIQAEQCAFLTHYTGSCQIKLGNMDDLILLKEQLSEQRLLVTID